MHYRKVKSAYKAVYTNPIVLNKGDKVTLGREEESEKWKGWIWAETDDNKGWIPKQIVDSAGESKGIITAFYTAKELNAEAGDEVEIIKELNGWAWVKNISSHSEGWLPLEILE